MAKIESRKRPRSTIEDKLRAVGYAYLLSWSVVYFFYPPISSIEAVDWIVRGAWMFVTFLAAALCFIGALRRVDLKMEFPGLLLAILATSLFAFTQLYFAVVPNPQFGQAVSRYALVIYACLPPLFLLPRTASLWIEARRLKRINTTSVQTALHVLEDSRSGGKK